MSWWSCCTAVKEVWHSADMHTEITHSPCGENAFQEQLL